MRPGGLVWHLGNPQLAEDSSDCSGCHSAEGYGFPGCDGSCPYSYFMGRPKSRLPLQFTESSFQTRFVQGSERRSVRFRTSGLIPGPGLLCFQL
jgi:hypothetical protein